MSRDSGGHRGGSGLGVTLALVVLVSTLGLTLGAGTLGPGRTETGAGSYSSEAPLAYWTWEGTKSADVPTPAPATASTTEDAPTLLARAARSYGVSALTAGQPAIDVEWEETTAAPRSTELVLTFVLGTTTSAVTIHLYVETRAGPLVGDVLFQFYWDAGTATPTDLTIGTAQATAQACTAVGDCP